MKPFRSGRIGSLLFGLIVCEVGSGPAQTTGLSIRSYDIQAEIHPSADSLDVKTVCNVQLPDSAQEVRLLLGSESHMRSVRLQTNGAGIEVPFSFAGRDTIRLNLPRQIRREKPYRLEFRYDFPISSPRDSMLLLDKGSRWYPLLADQVSSARLRCTVPEGLNVLSTGDLDRTGSSPGRMQFLWESSLPVFKIPLVVFAGNLRRDTVRVGEKLIVLFSSTLGEQAAARILNDAKAEFDFLTDLIGRYPYKCLTLVEVPYFDGVDVASGLLMVGSASLGGAEKGYFEPIRLTIAEQWFGAGVFGQFRQPGFWFFTVSLPHYLRLMYLRHVAGENAFDEALRQPLERYKEIAGTAGDVPLLAVDIPDSREKGVVLYAKGPAAINLLKKRLGDLRWKALLRDLYTEFRGKILTYDTFRERLRHFDEHGGALTLLDSLMTQTGMPPE